MSTFILALFELIGDIKYFLVVLVVVIFMFGDMCVSCLTSDNIPGGDASNVFFLVILQVSHCGKSFSTQADDIRATVN